MWGLLLPSVGTLGCCLPVGSLTEVSPFLHPGSFSWSPLSLLHASAFDFFSLLSISEIMPCVPAFYLVQRLPGSTMMSLSGKGCVVFFHACMRECIMQLGGLSVLLLGFHPCLGCGDSCCHQRGGGCGSLGGAWMSFPSQTCPAWG